MFKNMCRKVEGIVVVDVVDFCQGGLLLMRSGGGGGGLVWVWFSLVVAVAVN